MVEAAALRLRFAFFPLFQQRFVVTECSLFEPKLIVRQLPSGDWLIPLPPARTPEIAVTPQGESTTPSTPIKGPSFKAELQLFRLSGATLTFIDAKGRLILFAAKFTSTATLCPGIKRAARVLPRKWQDAGTRLWYHLSR